MKSSGNSPTTLFALAVRHSAATAAAGFPSIASLFGFEDNRGSFWAGAAALVAYTLRACSVRGHERSSGSALCLQPYISSIESILPSPCCKLFSHLASSTFGGAGRGCNIFVLVLGGNGTIIAPTGDIFDQPPGQMR